MQIGPQIADEGGATRFIESVRTGTRLCLIGLCGFSVAGPWISVGPWPGPSTVIDVIETLGCLGFLWSIGRVQTYEAAVRLTLGGVSVLTITTAATGAFNQDVQATPILLVLLSMGTATLVPWGVRAQVVHECVTVVAAVASISVITGILPSLSLVVAIIVASVTSAYMAYSFERSRDIRRRADVALVEARSRRHQAELAQAARLSTIGGMAASLAHELNQPLGAISTYAQGVVRRVQAGDIDRDRLLEVATEIVRQAMRASEMLQSIRDFVRHREPRRERIDANDIVRRAMQLAEREARGTDVALRLDLAAEPLTVEGDGVQIEQVVLNLAQNAIDAMRDGNQTPRELVVATRMESPTSVEVAVRDTGIGMPATTIAEIGTPFVTTKPQGLGLGLAISRSIVEAHGGRLWASLNPTRGTTVRFTLPAA